MLPIDIASATPGLATFLAMSNVSQTHDLWFTYIQDYTSEMFIDIPFILLGLKYCSSVNISSRHPGYCSKKLKSPEASFGRHWRPGDR